MSQILRRSSWQAPRLYGGIDPQNPVSPAPLPLDDEQQQADLRALDAKLSSSGDIKDAWALYSAMRSGGR